MNQNHFESKSLVIITLSSYVLNLLFGLIGVLCDENTNARMISYQVGNAFAITGSVMAGRYIGLRGQHVAASACILLGITHGISLAALSRAAINVDRGMTMVLPMIPALVCMFWCRLFPVWLQFAALIPISFFTLVYIRVQLGYSYFDWPLTSGYATLHTLEVIWGIYLVKDWNQTKLNP